MSRPSPRQASGCSRAGAVRDSADEAGADAGEDGVEAASDGPSLRKNIVHTGRIGTGAVVCTGRAGREAAERRVN